MNHRTSTDDNKSHHNILKGSNEYFRERRHLTVSKNNPHRARKPGGRVITRKPKAHNGNVHEFQYH